MKTKIPEKLLKIIDDIKTTGNVTQTRLTVLKKWFEQPYRIACFALFVAKYACAADNPTSGEEGELFAASQALLADADFCCPELEIDAALTLYRRLRDFQNDYEQVSWGQVRIVRNHNLWLVEMALHLYLWGQESPPTAYNLAARFCENYNPRYGSGLNGPSMDRIHEIVVFLRQVESIEHDDIA